MNAHLTVVPGSGGADGALVCAVVLAAAGAAFLPAHRGRAAADGVRPSTTAVPDDDDWVARHRVLWAALGGLGAALFVGGPAAVPVGFLAALGLHRFLRHAETPAMKRRREAARRDLPGLVLLVAEALRAGVAPHTAAGLAARALPGEAADRVTAHLAPVRLGADPLAAWTALAADPDLGPLGRALERAHETGSSVQVAVDRLAHELTRSAQAGREERARGVGVRAALPLGLCLLPAFLLLGIVPVAVGLLSQVGL